MSATIKARSSGAVGWTRSLRTAAAEFFRLGGVIGDVVRDLRARRKTRWEMSRTIDALQALDPRTLHDIGADRSEAGSIAAELQDAAARTRRRILDEPQWR